MCFVFRMIQSTHPYGDIHGVVQSYGWEGEGEARTSVRQAQAGHIRYDKLKVDTGTCMKRSKAWSVVLLHRVMLARDSIRRRCTCVWPTELNLCLTQRHHVVLYRVMFACVCFPNDSVDSFRRRGTGEKPIEAYFSIRESHVHAFIAQTEQNWVLIWTLAVYFVRQWVAD